MNNNRDQVYTSRKDSLVEPNDEELTINKKVWYGEFKSCSP